MGRIIYNDGRTALTTTAFRYKLTDSAGTLVKDWTTSATWTEEPAGTYYLDDEDAVPGTYYAVEPATGEVGATGMVPVDVQAAAQAAIVAEPATLAADQPLYAPTTWRDLEPLAKKEDVQITVPEPVFAGTVTFSGTVEAPAVTVNPTLTPEESAKLLGAAQEATAQAIADAVAALPTAPVGTRIDQTSEDASGEVLGLATPGSSITAYLASDTERTDPKRHTTAASDGTWALYLTAGTYVLVAALDGYYDAADGDSVIERTVVVP